MVIAVMSTVAALGIVLFKNTAASVRSTKLQQDVAALNRAVKTYAMSGGELETATTGDAIIAKLKTVAAGNQRSKIAGLRGSMLDSRLLGVPSTENGAPRAVWNSGKKTFHVQTSGSGFQEFRLDEKIAASPPAEDSRAVTMALDKRDKWIWNFSDVPAGAASPAQPTAANPDSRRPGAPPADTIRTQLSSPVFSIPGGRHALRNFDLSLILNNPNPSGTAEILFSLNGGTLRAYDGPIILEPKATVSAMARSLDFDNWADSPLASQNYQVEAVPLRLAFAVPKTSVTYQEMGGRMLPGRVSPPEPLAPGWASLTNAGDIPAKYQNDSVFTIRWTYDGSDPLAVSSAVTGSSFYGGFPGQDVAIALAQWGSNSSLRINVAAASMNSSLVTHSPVVGATLTALPVTLRPPLISLDPATGRASIALDPRFSDMPEGAGIGYTTDATDPAVQLGSPGITVYTEPFISQGETRITARVYPPVGREAWFIASSPVSIATPLIQKLQPPLIALSRPQFGQNVQTVSVTLANPNPNGSSQLYYAIKQPADAFPALTAFLPYSAPLTATSSVYPNGFEIRSYAKTLLALSYSDSDPAEAAATATNPNIFLVMDDDSLDNTKPGYYLPPNTGSGSNGRVFSASDVNSDLGTIGQRTPLRFFNNPANFGKVIVIRSGQVGDEGIFAVKTVPASLTSAGPTTSGIRNFIGNPLSPFPHSVGNGLGSGNDPESRLDNIPDVTPLRATGLKNLIGRTVGAVVYDSDVSINYAPLQGSLKGKTLGVVAFKVLEVKKAIGFSSSSLPLVTIEILDPAPVFAGSLQVYDAAPVPVSSASPADITP